MTDQPTSLSRAIERISRRLRIDAAAAIDKLIEVAANGTVRSTGEWVEFGHRRMSLVRRWHSRTPLSPATTCNLANNSISHFSEGAFRRVEVDSGDLDDWLDGLVTPSHASAGTVGPALTHASEAEIRKAIDTVYDEADRTRTKPPNVKELPARVQDQLLQKERQASGRRILQLASEFAHRRRRPGRTVLSESLRRR